MSKKIIIITNGNFFARLILEKFILNYSDNIVGVLIVTGDYKARSGFNALINIGKVTTLPYLLYKISFLIASLLMEYLFPNSIFSVEKLAKENGLQIKKCISVNSNEALEWVSSKTPDLIVSVSCPQLIRQPMLSLPKLAGINIHSSLLPQYAGLAPYYWVLSNGEKKTGTTVHFLTSKFDEGNILIQKELEINSRESTHHLFERLAKLGSDALVESAKFVFEGNPGTPQDLNNFTYFSHPSWNSYVNLKKNGHELVRIREIINSFKNNVHRHN